MQQEFGQWVTAIRHQRPVDSGVETVEKVRSALNRAR